MRFLLTLIGALAIHGAATAACPPAGVTRSELKELRVAEFEVADHGKRQALAIGFVGCLADRDPELRDETASEALRTWIRTHKLDVATLHSLRFSQVAAIQQADAAGFAQPFAALVLADLVNADIAKPFLSESDLAEIVQVGTTYLSGLRDYRGYDQKEGWRHAVPHTADLLMELAHHKAVGKKDQQRMLEAVATQLYAAGSQSPPQFYHFWEGSRMARAVFTLAERSDMTAAEWEAWFGAFVTTPEERRASKPELFARHHNFKSFLMPLYMSLVETKDVAQRERVLPYVAKALKRF